MIIESDYKRLYDAIDEILWNDWNPIGVNDSAPRDEYRSYVPQIVKLKINHADTEIIAQTLVQIATEKMCLLGNIDDCRRVANMIVLL